jgi:CRISPR/Cas system-associated exonuclease Cas4 (RecB family)
MALCYATILSKDHSVSNLELLYADDETMESYKIQIVDISKWIEERLIQIYSAVSIRKTLPPAEPSWACKYCKFKKRCESEDISNE